MSASEKPVAVQLYHAILLLEVWHYFTKIPLFRISQIAQYIYLTLRNTF